MNTDITKNISRWEIESDLHVDQLIRECDDTVMPLPDVDFHPNILISKVRKHYMEYIIKLLSVNYENSQKLLNKNIYLPSAIWRCATNIEKAAAQTCMVVQIYRKNIISVIKDLKSDTNKGVLFRKLYECLHTPAENVKKTQTNLNPSKDCTCRCVCNQRKRRRINSPQNKTVNRKLSSISSNPENMNHKIPVLLNSKAQYSDSNGLPNTEATKAKFVSPSENKMTSAESPSENKMTSADELQNNIRMSMESQNSDELMQQLEKLFQDDGNDDDLFEGTLCQTVNLNTPIHQENSITEKPDTKLHNQDGIGDQTSQIKSLDERLASLAGLLVNNENPPQSTVAPKTRRVGSNKWLCEEYFLKRQLFELLDQIRDVNRQKFTRIKALLLDLFGNDSDDENAVSPLEETPEFVISCKERIAPWVVKLLTPYYVKGRIKGKALFKSLAKHLIRLIYQCSRYPSEYEVRSFISDFLNSHKLIRCEADYRQFKIDNI